jgi:Protein of unknown function (DUF3426)
MMTPAVTPAQRVLDDLAKRNRNPKPASDWQPEDVDTGPGFLASRTTPLDPGPSFRASGSAPLQASAPFRASGSAPLQVSAPFRASAPMPIAPAPPATGEAPSGIGPTAPATQPAHAFELRVDPLPIPTGTEAADPGPPSETSESFFQSTGELDLPTAHPSTIDIVLEGPEPESDAPTSGGEDAVDSRYLSFVQQADKAARWRRPWVRAGLGVLALGLAVLLAAQVAVAQRDLIAAQWPEARPSLLALCGPINCRIEPLRRIDRLSVDSSGLTRIEEGPIYRLAMVLRNRSDTALLLPFMDLSLTDSAGGLVARRVLSASELGAQRTTIAPGQELPLQALLLSSERPLTGYTIEIFYP